MHEIGILVSILAACLKPNLSLRLVDPLDAAEHKFPPGDLFQLASPEIQQVEVSPAVTLGNVNRFFGARLVIQQAKSQRFDMSGPNKRVGFFVDQILHGATGNGDGDQSKALMPAVDLFIREGFAILAPTYPGATEVDFVHLWTDLLFLHMSNRLSSWLVNLSPGSG